MTYKAGLCRRLSDEDKSDMEDNSIDNQSKICLDYLKDKEDIHLISTYTDNGFTGTNFNRAGFIEMMNDIEAGKTSKLPPVINYQCSQYLRYIGLNDCFNHYIPETVVIESIKML